jgi:MarR-like DNA-binding transcriptional regulator SgrR of sgrS sRNA
MANALFAFHLEAAYRRKELTRLEVHIGYKLAAWKNPCPTHAQLAKAAGCDERTVRRALAKMRELGLLTWSRQVVVLHGWRAQIANRYELLSSKPISYLCFNRSDILSASGAAQAAQADLARVAQASQARILAAWQAKRAGRA